MLLFLGTALFAVFTRGNIGEQTAVDSKLSARPLWIMLCLTFLNCFYRICKWPLWVLPGSDAHYIANRSQLLLVGLQPFKHFEFAYGPLLLYPIVWLQHLLHCSTLAAYNIIWMLYWHVGIWMVWFVVRNIDFKIPSRAGLFVFLVGTQLAFAYFGGLNYTPVRTYFSSFCIVVVLQVWLRTKSSSLTASAVVFLIGLGICCSMDQAVGLTIGAFTIMGWLWLSPERNFSGLAIALAALGTLVCFYLADRVHITEALKSFGSGGYSYPILPSPAIFLTVCAYIIAGCTLLRIVFIRFFGQHDGDRTAIPIAVPLTLAGCSMIPNALGRSDILHITAAIPAFAVGVAAIFTVRSLRRWWLPCACLALILLPLDLGSSPRHSLFMKRLSAKVVEVPDPALLAQGYTERVANNQLYFSKIELPVSQLPCDHHYFTPSFMPVSTKAFLPQCLDTGYYLGFVNVTTVKAIQAKVDELKEHASQPLLLENIPLEAQIPLQLSDNQSLYAESETFWVPPVRHKPLTYEPVIEYIRQHYVPGPVLVNGKIRVWYPAGSPEAMATISK